MMDKICLKILATSIVLMMVVSCVAPCIAVDDTPRITFDTGSGTSPSIFGTHKGTITPSQTITVSKLCTYPSPGTGGHTEYVKIWDETWGVEAKNMMEKIVKKNGGEKKKK